MPLVKGTRSKLYTGSSHPRPPYITEVEKLQDALLRSEQEVLKMREQMEFLAFLVRRAWQGDKTAMSDVASIVGCETASVQENLAQFTDKEGSCDGEKWADMVERMLWVERQRDSEQVSTVKLAERECMLEGQLDNHTPVFSSYLNKPRGNFRQKKARAKSAAPVRTNLDITPGNTVMTKPPSVPAPSPRASPNTRPRSAPAPKKLATSNVSVHGSEVMIAHTPNNSKIDRCPKHSYTCTCPVLRYNHEAAWHTTTRFGVPTSAQRWADQGNLQYGMQLLKEKDQLMVAILCAAGK